MYYNTQYTREQQESFRKTGLWPRARGEHSLVGAFKALLYFEIGFLNRPRFTNNFQSLVTVDQSLYDAKQTKHSVRSAQLGTRLAVEDGRRTEMDVIALISNCPQLNNPCNAYNPTPVRLLIWE